MLSGLGEPMSITTEILSLRREKSSSVATLIGLIEWGRQEFAHISLGSAITAARANRCYAILEAADKVLLNVAAHAAEAMIEPPTNRKTRRFVLPFRRTPRRSDPGQMHQRKLFA